MDIILYTLNCPKCKILEDKLNKKNIEFEKSGDMECIAALGFTSVPVLKVDETYMTFNNAVKWISELEEIE